MNLSVEELLIEYRPLIMKLANYYVKHDKQLEVDDLFQAACLKIVENYDRYDSTQSSVITFVFRIAKYAILDYVRNNHYLPYIPFNLRYLAFKANNYYNKFYLEHNRDISYDEKIKWMAQQLDIDLNDKQKLETKVKDIDYIICYCNRYSAVSIESDLLLLEDPLSKEQELLSESYVKLLEDPSDSIPDAISNIDVQRFVASLSYLTPKEYNSFMSILGLYDGIPISGSELARINGVKKQTINDSYHRALTKIKERNSKKNLI